MLLGATLLPAAHANPHACLHPRTPASCSCGPMMLDVLLKIKDEQARCRCAAAVLLLRCCSVGRCMLSPLLLCQAARPTAGCVCTARHRCMI